MGGMAATLPSENPPRAGMPSGSIMIITLAAALVCAIALRQFASIVGPLLLALMFSIAVAPVRTKLKARGAPEWAATGAMVVTVYAVVLGFGWAGLAVGTHFASMVASYGDDIDTIIASWVTSLSALGIDSDHLTAALGAVDMEQAADVVLALLGGFTAILSSFLFVVVLLFFTVIDAGGFADNLARVSGRGARTAAALRSFAAGTRSYMFVATGFGAIVAVADTALLLALGVRDAWLWGLLAFLTNYIPNVGFVIGVIPPAFVALVDQGVGTALAVVAAYCVINFVIQMLVQPRVVGAKVGLSASLTFLSLLWWAAIFGAIGAIIAVPLTLLVKALFVDHDPERAWVRPLLESGGPKATDGEGGAAPESEPAAVGKVANPTPS
jgi:AI-2 transport protein TqsA